MRKQIEDIREFHNKIAETKEGNVFDKLYTDAHIEALNTIALRGNLSKEELEETQSAVIKGDKVETLDGLVDQLYVLLGAAHEYGMLDKLEQAWDLVHENNMTKLDENGNVQKNENGKVIKPKNYKPVNLKVLF